MQKCNTNECSHDTIWFYAVGVHVVLTCEPKKCWLLVRENVQYTTFGYQTKEITVKYFGPKLNIYHFNGIQQRKKKKKHKPQPSFCSETKSIGSSTYSSNCEVPTWNCGEIAVINVSWTKDNPVWRFYGCQNFVRQTCMLLDFIYQ